MDTKTIQGRFWGVAPRYWGIYFEPWFLPMYKHALKHLQLSEHHAILDLGCGSGLFSSLAIATGAQLIGLDASPGLLEMARSRNPKNNFMEAGPIFLPFANNSFHVVTGFNPMQFTDDFEQMLSEASRVLKQDGRLAVGIWDRSDATFVLKAIGSLLPQPHPDFPEPSADCGNGKMEGMLSKYDLTLIHKATVTCPFLYNNIADGIKCFIGTSQASAAIEISSKAVVEETISGVLKTFRLVDGFHFLQNHFLVYIAEKKKNIFNKT